MEASLPSGYTQWSHFGQAEYLEAQFLMPGYILSAQGDRMAMAHSVEGRFPFLDYRLMQFAAGLPAHVKMKALDQKHLLKKACRGMIPESILRRPKQPYRAPDGSCFLGTQTAEYAAEMLSPRAIRDAGLFDPKSVALLVDKFLKGRAIGTKDNMALVAVLSTQLLTHQFRDYFKEAHTSCLHPAFNSKSAIS
jgi:asparagine synthase (glutamine-hydrolysing)